MQEKRDLQAEYERPGRKEGLVDADAPVSSAVKNLVERLTADFIPDQFANPS
jgi:hypothetical protein